MITVTTKEDEYNICAENREKYLRNFFTYIHIHTVLGIKKFKNIFVSTHVIHMFIILSQSKKSQIITFYPEIYACICEKRETFINVT